MHIQIDGFALAAAIVTGLSILALTLRNRFVTEREEANDGPAIAVFLVVATALGVAIVLIVGFAGAHPA
jgi:hypothetical protein